MTRPCCATFPATPHRDWCRNPIEPTPPEPVKLGCDPVGFPGPAEVRATWIASGGCGKALEFYEATQAAREVR